MKRVLHLLTSNTFSGAENVVCTIIEKMSDKYEMVYCSPKGKIEENLKERNIIYYPINKLSFKELKRVLKEYKPDIIHAHDNRATVYASFFSNKYKVISHIHGNNKIMNTVNIKTLLFNVCSKKIKHIIWVSDSSLQGYVFKKNIMDKSLVLYNVIDKDLIVKKSMQYNCNEKYDVIFLGRLGYPKNPKRMINVISIAINKSHNLKAAIVGDGPDRKEIEELIEQKNIEKNVKLYGFQSNPYPILKNSKVLIMTSIYEGMPMCALEAQSLGKPIIATPVDGLKKIVKNNVNGYLSNDDEKLSMKIVELIENNKLYENYSSESIKKFDKINDITLFCYTIDQLYNE